MQTDNKTTERKQRNHHKSGKLAKKRDLKYTQANWRANNPTGHLGTKEKVKKGIITACEALKVVPGNTKTGLWLTNKAKVQKC